MQKILIIDDDADFCEVNKVILEENGFSVEIAQNGEEGLAKIKEANPNLVILDVMMSYDYEGFDVARKIREDLKLISLPIIVLTAIRSTKDIPYKFGPDKDYFPVDTFVEKPVDADNLIRIIKELLGELREEPNKRL